ncbi:glycosyl hydrolase family 28-related protein [Chryseobacterium sp. MYb328]|uniref:glycosyl hydrolase family 28-related protein n=1 Tax=Chryseobacterium sp. MYb328 TaxID=2745231 RepID=UPI00309F677C
MNTIELNDVFTGEWTVFLETNENYIGNPITDAMCDEIIYKKIDQKYYRRVLENNEVNVQWFGAKGDGITEDTHAVQLAVDFLKNIKGGTLFFPKAKYVIQSVDFIGKEYSNISIIGNQAVIKQKIGIKRYIDNCPVYPSGSNTPEYPRTGENDICLWNGYKERTSSRHTGMDGVFVFNSKAYREYNDINAIKNIKIKGIRFESQNNVTEDFDELMSQVVLCGVSNVLIEECEFIQFYSDGITILGSINEHPDTKRCYNGYVEIRNCLFDGVNCNNRQGVSVYYCDRSLIENCTFKNITRSAEPGEPGAMPGAIDYESDSVNIYQRSAIVRNCYFENIGGSLGAISILIHNVKDEYPDPMALAGYTPEVTNSANPDLDSIKKANSFKGFVFENNIFEKVLAPLSIIGIENYMDYKGNYIVKFVDSSVNHAKLLMNLSKAYGVLIENNSFTNIKEGALAREGANKVLLKNNNISNVGEEICIHISDLSSHIEIIGNTFKHIKALAINFQNKLSLSNSKIIDNDFGTPQNLNNILMVLGSGNATPEDFINLEIRGNKHSGFNDIGIYPFMVDPIYPNYTQIPPSKILYGVSEFQNADIFPDPTYLGNLIGMVKNERLKDYNGIPIIVQTFIPYDPINKQYRRVAVSNTAFSAWKEI